MQVGVKEAGVLLKKHGEKGVPLFFLTDFRYQKSGCAPELVRHGTPFTAELGDRLLDAAVADIDLISTERLLDALRGAFPERYRRPYCDLSFVEIDKTLHAFTEINKHSRRQRAIISMREVYRKEGPLISVSLEYGQPIELARWNSIKSHLDKHQRFEVRYSEHGVIVFVDLRPEGENYLQRFYKNSDLVTSLVGHRQNVSVQIAPDFISEMDVITVDDPEKLLETYERTNARLIIIGDALSPDYRNALAKVKAWDRYARFLMATNIDQGNLEAFLLQVQKSYQIDNFSINDF